MKSQSNGCGPSGLVGKIIPDSLLGVSVHEACNIHDVLYSKGGSSQDRKEADEDFLKMMLEKLKDSPKKPFLNSLRKFQAYLYFWSVRIFGRYFFNKLESDS